MNTTYYKKHGVMTQVDIMKDMITSIPKDIKIIVTYVQNILLHQHWASSYGVNLDRKRKQETWLRSFEEKLKFLKKVGFTHVSDKKKAGNKMVGICRDYAVIAAALCREAGIAARARCGFALYFEKGKYVDHWVLEYYNVYKKRWIFVDPQLDSFQQKQLNITFNPLDVGEENFITAPRAWLMCRNGEADPNLFGILQWWGYDYLKCNLILDANSLIKVPMQPWDGWDGYKNISIEKLTENYYLDLDQLAKLTLNVDRDFQEMSTFINQHDKIKVPSDFSQVINYLE